jgi:hypothetical protein
MVNGGEGCMLTECATGHIVLWPLCEPALSEIVALGEVVSKMARLWPIQRTPIWE